MPGPWGYLSEILDPISQTTIEFAPPAPAFSIVVSYAGNITTLPALIDTGADCTVIPQSIVSLLSLRKISSNVKVKTANNQRSLCSMYKADLRFLDFNFPNHPIVSIQRRNVVLIGRDILNLFKATFDGPTAQFSIE